MKDLKLLKLPMPIGLYENHASIVDGQVVPDSGYDPDADRPAPDPSPEQQMIAALTLEVAKLKAAKS